MQAGSLLHCASGRAFCLQQALNPLALRKRENLFLYEAREFRACLNQEALPLLQFKSPLACRMQEDIPPPFKLAEKIQDSFYKILGWFNILSKDLLSNATNCQGF